MASLFFPHFTHSSSLLLYFLHLPFYSQFFHFLSHSEADLGNIKRPFKISADPKNQLFLTYEVSISSIFSSTYSIWILGPSEESYFYKGAYSGSTDSIICLISFFYLRNSLYSRLASRFYLLMTSYYFAFLVLALFEFLFLEILALGVFRVIGAIGFV